jgi:hypothetical protein
VTSIADPKSTTQGGSRNQNAQHSAQELSEKVLVEYFWKFAKGFMGKT